MRRLANGIRTRAGRRHIHIGAACAVLALSCGTTTLKGDTGIRPFAFDLWDVRCPSGLRVLFERAPGAYTAGVTVVVGSGATADPPGREGLAHLVEHLVFRGRDAGDVALSGRLWQMGASYNASTSFDETTYHAFLPGQNLRQLVQRLGERLMDPLRHIDEATFLVERDVVRNELRERNETHAAGAAFGAAYQAAFPADHPYGRPMAGTHESLSALSMTDAAAFVAAHYRPENMTMVVVGDFDLTKAEAFARENLPPAMYGDPAHPRAPLPPPAPAREPPPPPAKTALHREPGPVTTPELWITWTLPGGATRELEIARMWSMITGSNFSYGRFDDDDVSSVEVGAYEGLLGSVLIFRVRLTEGSHPDRSLREVLASLPWVADDDVYLQTRVRQLKASRLRALASDAEGVIDRSVDRAAYAHRTGSPSMYGALVEQIRSITDDEAEDVAKRYLAAGRARAVLVTPLADDARPAQPISALHLATYYKHEALSQETLRDLGGVRHTNGLQTTTLDNGLEVVVLPRPGAPVVTGTLAFHGDRAAESTGLARAAREAMQFRLLEAPSDYGIEYVMRVGLDFASSTVTAGASNMPRALDLLQFGTRSLDTEWPSDKFREVRVPLLRRQERSPEERAQRAHWKALFGDHPFGATPLVDQIAAHKSGEIQTWVDRVFSPANGVLVVVGDVDVAEVQRAARDSLGQLAGAGSALPAPAPVEPPARPLGIKVLDSADDMIVTHRPGATQAALRIGCLLPPADARGEATDAVMAAAADDWLENELRGRTGSTYGVHTWTTTLRGGTAMLTITANIDNGRLGPAMDSLRTFWRQATTTGIDEDDVRDARDSKTTAHLLSYDSSSAIAAKLVDLWNQGWGLPTLDEKPAYYAAVQKADVDRLFRVCGANLVVGLTGDEATIRKAVAWRPTPKPTPAPAAPAPATP